MLSFLLLSIWANGRLVPSAKNMAWLNCAHVRIGRMKEFTLVSKSFQANSILETSSECFAACPVWGKRFFCDLNRITNIQIGV